MLLLKWKKNVKVRYQALRTEQHWFSFECLLIRKKILIYTLGTLWFERYLN